MDTEEQNEQPKQDSEEARRAEQMQQLRSAQAIIEADKRMRAEEYAALLKRGGDTLRCRLVAEVYIGGRAVPVPITVEAL